MTVAETAEIIPARRSMRKRKRTESFDPAPVTSRKKRKVSWKKVLRMVGGKIGTGIVANVTREIGAVDEAAHSEGVIHVMGLRKEGHYVWRQISVCESSDECRRVFTSCKPL